MGSTNFNAPPLKMTLLAISVVVALHVLTAMALVAIKPLTPAIQPTEVTPPIEIQMLTLPVEVKEPAIELDTTEPVKETLPHPKPVSVTEPKPKIAKESQPVAQPKSAVKTPVTPEKPQPNTSKMVKKEPFRHEIKRQESMSTVQADALAADKERNILAAQTEKATQQAHAKAMRDAQAAEDAKVLESEPYISQNEPSQKFSPEPRVGNTTADDQLRFSTLQQQDAIKNKARKQAQAVQEAAESAARAQATAAASNTPVNFTANNANWAAKPNFSFPDRGKRGASSGDTFNVILVLRVNKQGGIDSVSVAQSSGNAILDREAQRQVRSGKFRPFTRNGVAVVGNVTLPISYAVP